MHHSKRRQVSEQTDSASAGRGQSVGIMKTLREKAPPDEIEACVKAEVAHHDFTVPILAQVPSRRHTRVPSHFQDFRGVPGLAKAPAEVEGSNLKKAKTDDCASSSCSDAYSGHHDKFPASTQTQTCSRRNARVPSHFDDFHGVPGLSSYSFKEETPRKQRATAAPLAIASPAANLGRCYIFSITSFIMGHHIGDHNRILV